MQDTLKRWVNPFPEKIWHVAGYYGKNQLKKPLVKAFQSGWYLWESLSWLKLPRRREKLAYFISVACWECLVRAAFGSGYANSNVCNLCMQTETHGHPGWLLAFKTAKKPVSEHVGAEGKKPKIFLTSVKRKSAINQYNGQVDLKRILILSPLIRAKSTA